MGQRTLGDEMFEAYLVEHGYVVPEPTQADRRYDANLRRRSSIGRAPVL
jgi:hypothetical protein